MRLFYLLGVLISLFIGCTQEVKKTELGPAQSFTLLDTDSISHSLNDYDSHLVMVHFWADWCPNCRKEFPKLQKAYARLNAKGFEILAVNSGQSRDHVLEIKNTYGLTFPLLVDEEAKTAALYKVAGLPTTYFIDKKGVIRESVIGWMEEEQIVEIFEKLESEG